MRERKMYIHYTEFEVLIERINYIWDFFFDICESTLYDLRRMPVPAFRWHSFWRTVEEFRSLQKLLDIQSNAEGVCYLFEELEETKRKESATKEELYVLEQRFLKETKELLYVAKRIAKRAPEMIYGSYSEVIEKTAEPSDWVILAMQRKIKDEGLVSRLKDAGRREDYATMDKVQKEIHNSVTEFMKELAGQD